jgi:TRAP-type C4-dicarboxylate transport system permease small subunit
MGAAMRNTFRVGATIATISFLAWFGLGGLLLTLDVLSGEEFTTTWAFIWVFTFLPLGFVIPLFVQVWISKKADKRK